ARAAQLGEAVPETALARVQTQVAASFDSKAGGFRAGGVGTGGLGGVGGGIGRAGAPAASAPTDAGVPIYTAGAFVSNAADIANAQRQQEQQAREVLAKKDSSEKDKEKA